MDQDAIFPGNSLETLIDITSSACLASINQKLIRWLAQLMHNEVLETTTLP